MDHEKIIKNKIGKDHGFKTPDGFLEPVYEKVSRNLPERVVMQAPPRTFWQRVKPYVYLAAMFAGLWCTMKIVSQMQISRTEKISLDNPPALVAQALSTPEVESQMNFVGEVNDLDIMTDAVASYDNIDEFKEDFDYEFTDQVADIDVRALQAELMTDDTSSTGDDDFDEDFYYDYYASI